MTCMPYGSGISVGTKIWRLHAVSVKVWRNSLQNGRTFLRELPSYYVGAWQLAWSWSLRGNSKWPRWGLSGSVCIQFCSTPLSSLQFSLHLGVSHQFSSVFFACLYETADISRIFHFTCYLILALLIVFVFSLFRHSGGQKQAEVPDLRPGAGGGRGESERAGLRSFPVPPRWATENIVGKVTKERIFFWFYLPNLYLQIFWNNESFEEALVWLFNIYSIYRTYLWRKFMYIKSTIILCGKSANAMCEIERQVV